MEEEYIKCFSCGSKSLHIDGAVHNYMLSDPGCYEMFNEVLEKEYTDYLYAKAHHYTVDAYAIQHPGKPKNSKAVNSVGIHLVSLYFLFEKKMDLTLAAALKMEFAQFNKKHKIITLLKRPVKFEEMTIFDIWDNEKPERHFELCEKWAKITWNAWEKEHFKIEKWAEEFLNNSTFGKKIVSTNTM